jgi:hypothetical protein
MELINRLREAENEYQLICSKLDEAEKRNNELYRRVQ